VYKVVQQISGVEAKFHVKHDKRGYIRYRVTTKMHPYFKSMGGYVYDCRKELNTYSVSRIDEESLSHMWMCDGYLEHQKNRKLNKIQNVGWFCLEGFPPEELSLLMDHMKDKWDIVSTLVKKPWGFGYRIRVGGENLQKLISVVYPNVLPCFIEKKTPLYYKKKESADLTLPSAELYVREYQCIEDIVRHS